MIEKALENYEKVITVRTYERNGEVIVTEAAVFKDGYKEQKEVPKKSTIWLTLQFLNEEIERKYKVKKMYGKYYGKFYH